MTGTRQEPDNDWLTDESARLLLAPHGPQRAQRAARIGARVAESSQGIHDLVSAFLHAATTGWAAAGNPSAEGAAAVHVRAADLLATVSELIDAAIAGFHAHIQTELSDHDSRRAEFINDLLTGRAEPGRLAERAQRYGIRLSGSHIVTIATGAGLTDSVVHEIDSLLAARFGAGNTLTTLRDQQLVCISTGGLRGLPAELAHHLLARIGSNWQIAVGRPHPGIDGAAISLDEARNTLDLAAKLGFATPILHAADLLVFPVLLRDRDAITDLVNTVLGPLTQARGGAQPYLDTLTILFENQGNHTATARHMHLSVRAVTYRLDRIHALTGYHPAEPTQRFTLHAAVLGARLLGWPHTT